MRSRLIVLLMLIIFPNWACQPPADSEGDANSTAAASGGEPSSPQVADAEGAPNTESTDTLNVDSTDTETDTQSEATIETAAAAEPLSDEGGDAIRAKAAELGEVTVLLGSPDVTAGIPGEGELTLEQIRTWLDNPENHRVIKPELPPGLAAAAGNIQGIDANPLTRAKIELGRQLYFDGRLSSDGTISCASCHHPDEGYGRATQFGVGVGEQTGDRNSPISYNRIVSSAQFWDGRAASLEEQAAGPIANPIEMGNTHEAAIKTISDIEGYRVQFARIFPGKGINIDTVTQAIASFERAIVTATAPYDHYERVLAIQRAYGEDIDELEEEDPELFEEYQASLAGSAAMSDSAKNGRDLFFSDRVGCTACHAGANFTDELYHNIGVGMDAESPDLGRYKVTNNEKDKGAFKTPTVRNVALSAPYMHDGSQKTLMEVVEWYAKGGHPNPHLSDKIKKIDLTEQEKKDLVAFMEEGLTSDFPPMETERLP